MPNIEIKARCADPIHARATATRLQTEYLGELKQTDTYFHTRQGRLKLREIPGQGAALIPYLKTYEKRPTQSDYQLLTSTNPEALKTLLSALLGTRFVVDKTREVFLIENVRVHLDRVVGLGDFIEFEAVFDEETEETRARETRKVAELMQTFGIAEGDLLTSGYVEMLEAIQPRSVNGGGTSESANPNSPLTSVSGLRQ